MNALPHLFHNSSQSAAAAIYTRHFDPLIDYTYSSHWIRIITIIIMIMIIIIMTGHNLLQQEEALHCHEVLRVRTKHFIF
jgi:hypothetical protein